MRDQALEQLIRDNLQPVFDLMTEEDAAKYLCDGEMEVADYYDFEWQQAVDLGFAYGYVKGMADLADLTVRELLDGYGINL